MASFLRPTVDGCQQSIRERRRSSVRSLALNPRIFTRNACADESALIDDDQPDLLSSAVGPTHLAVQSLSPLATVHISDYASKLTIPRHNDPRKEVTNNSAPPVGCTPSISQKRSMDSVSIYAESEPQRMERLRWRLASGYLAYFMCGWGDGVTATVLPHFMAEFHITFMTSSLLYAGSTCGFLIGTLLLESIMNRLGRVGTRWTRSSWIPFYQGIALQSSSSQYVSHHSALQARHLAVLCASSLHTLFFVIMGTRGGFPSLFIAYALAAFARSILTGSLNTYFAGTPKHLGYAFGVWSFGSGVSPLVCQAIMASGVPWFKFYYGSLLPSIVNVAFLVLTFNPTESEFRHEQRSTIRKKQSPPASPSSDSDNKTSLAWSEKKTSSRSSLRFALSLPYQWVISFFAAIYFGSETTTQAFMVSYLLETRHANPKTVGYVTSGFFAGITFGRFLWGYFTPSLSFTQRKYVIQSLVGLTMQFMTWFVKSVAVDAVSLAVIGLVYGPIFPACLSLANDVLPPQIRMVSMALISTSASIGCAILPFVTGVLLNEKGVQTLTYCNVALTGILTSVWALFPSRVPLMDRR